MQVYWFLVFLFQKSSTKEIEKLTWGFLWCQGELKWAQTKVPWDIVCLPREYGGLGIRNLAMLNMALMASNFRSILMRKESLWVRWIHSYRLQGKSIWTAISHTDDSFGLQNILNLRDAIRHHC